ncbi:hypothetical protein ILUMI_08197 [Ignelater luminosus]|uniref:Uncharacterized protein n=1 Tax=Ignelater luminosus TaxID=2038154 RepID=A0A8K0GG56_IGNLU|nr:hypothetical protein ILUMI_08197 [Ignelater luminosus]
MLEREHIEEFLESAPDEEYLMIKVHVDRCCELTNLKIDDIEDIGSYLLVSIPDTKTNISRRVTIIEEAVSLCKKYILLRPKGLPHRRFFLRYMNQKCTTQAVGINTLAKVPFLNLTNAELQRPTRALHETYVNDCWRIGVLTLQRPNGTVGGGLQQ